MFVGNELKTKSKLELSKRR